MSTSPPIRNAKYFRLIVLSMSIAMAASAHATVICSPATSLDVPATTEGLYVNFVTGVSGTSEAAVPGFDLDLYAAASTDPSGQLKFYWGPSSNGGAGVVSSGDTYAVLGAGVSIGPDSPFTRAAFTGDTTAWEAGTSGYLGMRFLDDDTGLTVYGWLALSTTASLGFPATVEGWCYEENGMSIVTPGSASDVVFVDGFEGPT